MRFRRSAASACLVVGVAALLSGCGDYSSPTTPTVVAPTRAAITVTSATPNLGPSAVAGFNFGLFLSLTAKETAGLGANINYIRAHLVLAGVEVERREISGADVLAQTGSNRLEANTTRVLNLTYHFNASIDTIIMEADFTDDRGNDINLSTTITLVNQVTTPI